MRRDNELAVAGAAPTILETGESRAFPSISALGACAALWLILHPYGGLKHDALIYMGRALADLDPNGVGRDLMFRFDGQSKFSVFSKIIDALVPVLGLEPTAEALTFVGLMAWFVAMAALAYRLSSTGVACALLLLVACSDSGYGGFDIFHFAEGFSTPRIFAEALVLAALVALLAERRFAALALLAASALFHPIMAASGILVAYLHECRRGPRWIVFGALGAAAVAAVVLSGAPIFGRLSARIDPTWAEIIELRSDYLFVADWPAGSWAALLRRSCLLLLAASLAAPMTARLLVCALAAGLLGLVASALFGDLLLSEIALQAQAWRTLWLVSAFSPLALGLAAPALWRNGPRGRVVLALVIAGWGLHDEYAGAALCAVGLVSWVCRNSWNDRSLVLVERAAWTLCAIAALTTFSSAVSFTLAYLRSAPAESLSASAALRLDGAAVFPISLIAVALLVGSWSPRPRHVQIMATLLAAAAVFSWNDAPPYRRNRFADSRHVELEALISKRQGEILWINDDIASWVWLGRAGWVSRVQGAGVVFSRTQALMWRERTDALNAVGWVSDSALRAQAAEGVTFPPFTRRSLETICGRADAPAWIIGAVKEPSARLDGLAPRYWRGPTQYALNVADQALEWTPVEHYAIFDCVDYQPKAGGVE